MFDGADTGVGGDAGDLAMSGGGGGNRGEHEWREIDRQLRRIARRRGELDADELIWLARAERADLHRQLGMASMLEYVERVLGHGPKAGRDRLRVARKLEQLPRMAAALDAGVLAFTAVRELSRFVVPETEEEWLDATRGKCLRDIEGMSSGRQPGDRPDDPVEPDLRTRPISLDLTPPTYALFLDARRRLEDELGHALTDEEMVYALCSTVLDAAPRGADLEPAAIDEPGKESDAGPAAQEQVLAGNDRTKSSAKPSAPRIAPYQVALMVCRYCDRAWHDATGRSIDMPTSTLEMALCDAQHIGGVDGDLPSRAYQEIPPAVARMVLRRDRGRCRVPGCRSSRWIHIHHIVPRELGGTNDLTNLVCLCSAHHQSLHRKQIALTGKAPDALVFDLRRYDPPPSPAPVTTTSPSSPTIPRRSQTEAVGDVSERAHQALVQMGWKSKEVQSALGRAMPHVGRADLEAVIRRALRELSIR